MITKQTKILAVVSAAILVAAIGYRMIDDWTSNNVNSISSGTSIVSAQNNSSANQKQVARIPPAGHISKSIDELARQIVANAPNQQEAYGYLVEAQSLRIQQLQTRRSKERAEEAKANYDADFWNGKRDNIEDAIKKESEKESVETQPGKNRFQYPYNQSSEQMVSDDDAPKTMKLSDFILRAIIKDGKDYIARISYGEKILPAKVGYKLLGKVTVESVTPSQVHLKKDDDELTLYAR